MSDGRTVTGSHALMCVGSVPNTDGLWLESTGIEQQPGGHIKVDRVSRTTAPGVHAAGDCTDPPPLAPAAAMQGPSARAHGRGEGAGADRDPTAAGGG